jgi:hypothetical protein
MFSTLLFASQANDVSLPLLPLQVSKFGFGSIAEPNGLSASGKSPSRKSCRRQRRRRRRR